MKFPRTPPDCKKFLDSLPADRIRAIIEAVQSPDVNQTFFHWDELRHRTPPAGLSIKEWWASCKIYRSGLEKTVPGLLDVKGDKFKISVTELIHSKLNEIEVCAAMVLATTHDPSTRSSPQNFSLNSLRARGW